MLRLLTDSPPQEVPEKMFFEQLIVAAASPSEKVRQSVDLVTHTSQESKPQCCRALQSRASCEGFKGSSHLSPDSAAGASSAATNVLDLAVLLVGGGGSGNAGGAGGGSAPVAPATLGSTTLLRALDRSARVAAGRSTPLAVAGSRSAGSRSLSAS